MSRDTCNRWCYSTSHRCHSPASSLPCYRHYRHCRLDYRHRWSVICLKENIVATAADFPQWQCCHLLWSIRALAQLSCWPAWKQPLSNQTIDCFVIIHWIKLQIRNTKSIGRMIILNSSDRLAQFDLAMCNVACHLCEVPVADRDARHINKISR